MCQVSLRNFARNYKRKDNVSIMQQVTTKKFAEMCGVSDANIRGMISRNKLNAVKDINGNHLLDIEDETNRLYLDNKRNSSQQISQDIPQVIALPESNSIERITQRIGLNREM